jgi:hypothetical protein
MNDDERVRKVTKKLRKSQVTEYSVVCEIDSNMGRIKKEKKSILRQQK